MASAMAVAGKATHLDLGAPSRDVRGCVCTQPVPSPTWRISLPGHHAVWPGILLHGGADVLQPSPEEGLALPDDGNVCHFRHMAVVLGMGLNWHLRPALLPGPNLLPAGARSVNWL